MDRMYWRTQLTCLKYDIEWGLDSNYVIIATYASFTNDKFQSILRAIAKDMILIAGVKLIMSVRNPCAQSFCMHAY